MTAERDQQPEKMPALPFAHGQHSQTRATSRWLPLVLAALAGCADTGAHEAPPYEESDVLAYSEYTGGVPTFANFDALGSRTDRAPWVNSYLMADLSDAAYTDPNEWQALDRRLVGLGVRDYAYYNVELTDDIYSTPFLVADTDKAIVVAIRGTVVGQNLTNDVQSRMVDFRGREVHNGFHRAMTQINLAAYDHIQLLLREKRRPVWITGHSLGGAVSTLLAYDLVNRNYDLPNCSSSVDGDCDEWMDVRGVVTFGQPEVGGVGWAEGYRTALGARTHRWTRHGDPIPDLPSRNYTHTGRQHYIDWVANPPSVYFDDPTDRDFPIWSIEDHGIVHYRDDIRALMP